MPTDLRAWVLIADYLAVDAVYGKITAVGLGWSVAPILPQTGMTPPMYVGVVVDVPPHRFGQPFPLTVDLRHDDGTLVQLPGPSGTVEALRISQRVQPQRSQAYAQLAEHVADLPGRVQTVIGFASGIPLAAGHSYFWRLELDGVHLKSWEAHFHIASPPPGPVLGGPAGPADIGDMSLPTDEDDEES